MQITLINLPGLERRLDIIIPTADIDSKVNEQLRKISSQVKIPGFRIGKIPSEVIRKRYHGTARIQAMQDAIRDSYLEAIERHNLHPVDQPTIEIKSSTTDGDCDFSATLEIYPEIKLQDMKEVEVTRDNSKVEDINVDRVLEDLRKSYGEWQDIDDNAYEAQLGDRLEIDFTMVSDPNEAGETESRHGEGVKVVLGDGATWSAFEQHLHGLKVGSEKQYALQMPSTHEDKNLADRRANFTVKVNKISRPILPALNDEFASKLRVSGGMEKLRTEIRIQLERELARILRGRFKNEIMAKLLEVHNVDVPKKLVERELGRQEKAWQRHHGSRGGDRAIPAFPKNDFIENAKRNVSLGLLLAEIAREYELKVELVEVRKRIDDLVPNHDRREAMIKNIMADNRQLDLVKSELLEEKTIDHLASTMKVIDRTIDYADLMNNSNAK